MTADPTTIAAPLPARRAPLKVVPVSEPAGPAGPFNEERFAAYIAHELRTPLATQRALLELTLSDPLSDTASWREVAADVLDACLQQERLLEACLALARSRRPLGRPDRIDLAVTVQEAIRTHDLSGLESIAVLEPAVICGDLVLVDRLVANLVSNAIRHNRPGGRIELGTCTRAGRALLVVANSGRLIPATELGRLFEPFYRLDGRPPSDGIGLGLSIVQAIADVHNASVTAEALSGGGLKVEVCFPAGPRL